MTWGSPSSTIRMAWASARTSPLRSRSTRSVTRRSLLPERTRGIATQTEVKDKSRGHGGAGCDQYESGHLRDIEMMHQCRRHPADECRETGVNKMTFIGPPKRSSGYVEKNVTTPNARSPSSPRPPRKNVTDPQITRNEVKIKFAHATTARNTTARAGVGFPTAANSISPAITSPILVGSIRRHSN